MLCENKLTNLVFKNQEEQYKTKFTFIYIYIYILKKTPRMKCMNVMICIFQRKKKKTQPKNNGHKGQ